MLTPVDNDAIFARWHDVFRAVGRVEQLGVRWEAAPGRDVPIPSLVWRLADANQQLLTKCIDSVRAFRGQVAWELTEPRPCGEGINWSLEPIAGDLGENSAARADFLSLLGELERLTGVR